MPHLEPMQPGAVLDSIHEIKKFDDTARRNYGPSESTVGGSLSINVLANPGRGRCQLPSLKRLRTSSLHLVTSRCVRYDSASEMRLFS
jgi:hypothetical protein